MKTTQKILSIVLALVMLLCTMSFAAADTLHGEAEGYNGKITAEVTVEDGKITALELAGAGETPAIGGAALAPLTEAILAAGTVDGVDAVAGATWTSNGVFAAVRNAMGMDEAKESAALTAVSASGLYQGLGIASTPRLGPGKDANGVGVYSFNEVVAYVILDSEKRIVDMEVDVLEIITPNHDESNDGDNFLAGWPGQKYNSDADGDGVIDGELEETDEIFTGEIGTWLTKRQKHSDYKMSSGTWEDEMDIYEKFFIGKTVDEIVAWNDKFTSDSNGRPLTAASKKDADIAKFSALTEEEKTVNDAITGATMSLTDPHGNLIEAIRKAAENAIPMAKTDHIAKVGLGITVTPRLGPGSDDQGMPCYSFNVVASGICFDDADKIVDMYTDVLEIITPNHDGADDNSFTGWPGQSYNADVDADGKVDEVWEQTEETFTAQISAFQTKRTLGSKYKMNSDTWVGEITGFESAMRGKTVEEVTAWFNACFSDINGRALHGKSTKELDVAKYDAMTDEQKAQMDAISTATMSLRDPHGDILTAIEQAFDVAKACDITVK